MIRVWIILRKLSKGESLNDRNEKNISGDGF